MKKIIFLFYLSLILSVISFGQKTGNSFQSIAVSKSKTTDWVKFKQNLNISPEKVFEFYYEALGLSNKDKMILKSAKTDALQMTHYRFQQTFAGVPVWGADYIIHAANGQIASGNGKLVNSLNINTHAQLSQSAAIQKAIAYTGAEKYMWQDVKNENMLKHIKNDPAATYYPEAELMIADKSCSRIASQYKLVYRVDVFAEKPMSRKDIFIDAQTGNVLFTINKIKNTDAQGTAVTKYSGTKTLITDSVAPGSYRLRCNTIGGGVETYDMNKGTNYGAAVDFTDTDNFWDNHNADQDEAATDAHYAAQMTYNFYKDKFNRLSFDDNDAKLISYVHYDNAYNNAFWNGYYMTYGDGNGTAYSAFTSVDVCAHEITHAVTEHSANLIYQDESGALNEGFSDIFGASVDFYADSANANWLIGEDFDLQGTGFRSLSDPKSQQLPDTYHGQYWLFNDVFDNGGVHTNCGVLAHWFYIMSNGKVGTNDLGQNYNVAGLGVDIASAIAYRALTAYLVASSQYIDARQATIWAAEDLYGQCSVEAINASAAWYAVGVGYSMTNYDLWMDDITYPKTVCGLSNAEIIQGRLIYNGCTATFLAGDTIPVSYKVDTQAVVNDTIILNADLHGGDTLNFSFNTPADFSAIGIHKINCWVDYINDNEPGNDTLLGYQFENKIQQNIDMGISKVIDPVSACHLGSETVKVIVQFFGCDSIPSGDSISLGYKVNNGTPVIESTVIPYTLFPRDTFSYQFNAPSDFANYGAYVIKAWTAFTPDTLHMNDTLSYTIKNPEALTADTIGFEETNLSTKILIETTPYSNAFTSYPSHHTGMKGLDMTGGNVMDYINALEMPSGSNAWSINPFLSAKVNFCVDATSWSTVNMRFDLKQTHGGTLYSQYLGAGDYTIASNFRILVNGTQIGGTYNPTTPASDPWITHFINLDAYAGTKFTLTFETRNIAKDTSIMGMAFKLDNAYVDNVCFSQNSQQSVENLNDFIALDVYPNPFNETFILKYDTDNDAAVNVVLTDVLGKVLINDIWNVSMGTNRKNIQLNDYPSGVYMIKIADKSGNVSRKIIKL